MTDSIRAPEPVAWRCPRCEAERAAADDFCGRCGARRPVEVAADVAADAKGRFPIARALILNGIIVGAVVVAVLLGMANGGPATIAFEPASWRCDGSERAWIAAIPAGDQDLRLDWIAGGPAGVVLASTTATQVALEPYRLPDGSVRVTATRTDTPECGLDPGEYTLAIRDAASNKLIAAGTVVLAP